MSLWFQSPMPKKFQAFFLVYVIAIMTTFALVGISVSMFHYGLAFALLMAALLMVGVGFMIRKRVLRNLGLLEQNDEL
ncbi:DUF5325 family protein [Tumebacillus lipolyticus]|uniref:DUF5325 family protein n=1 Tax=Tumebacillus lipolyticus TaxID=1280370 RepID=A0ABW4ZVB3_9BACL